MTSAGITFGSVCSGIEAASVAWHPLGWRAAWLAEIDPFASAVLAHHYPEVPNLGDLTNIAAHVLAGDVPAPDVLCGGTPCQAFSVAGQRESLADARGKLTLKFVELANAIDHVRAGRGEGECVVFWENVPGVLSTKDNAFGCFLAGLAGEDVPLQPPGQKWTNAGAVYGPRRAVAWRALDAQYFGLAQRRRRVFVVASARNGFDPAQVLFEWDGLRRDTAPRREARQDPAATIAGGARRRGGCSTDDVAQCLTTGTSQRYDPETETIIVHTLRGESFNASEDGTGRGTPLEPVAVDYTNGLLTPGGPVGTIEAAQSKGNRGLGVLAFDTTQITSPANRSAPRAGDPCHPLAAGAHAPAIAFPANLSATQCVRTAELSPALRSVNPTAVAVQASQSGLDANYGSRHHNGVMLGQQVRRLTPMECERLQGFHDGYTAIAWRGKATAECHDGPRYRALGNSWAVPVVRWLGRRIAQELAR